ncbi:MAG: rhodanese-related sulfurtransferase [Bacillota bacterium]
MMEHLDYRVLLFYKYVDFSDPESFRDEHYDFCLKHDIKGRIFIAREGINATVSGRKDAIEAYRKHITSYDEFTDIIFKEDRVKEHAFRKLHVRVKNEIVGSGLSGVTPGKGTKRLKPEELKELYENKRDFIIVDARNDYESIIGKFKGAITPPIKSFRQWPKVAEDLKEYKDKIIVTYCTGGIRCEKASAYLAQQGFKNVYQLEGGIVSYVKKYPDTFWEGSVFVFDERRSLEINSQPEIKHIARCHFCNEPTSYYINCHNQDCDRMLVACHKCKAENDYCCSDECRNSPNKRKRIHG